MDEGDTDNENSNDLVKSNPIVTYKDEGEAALDDIEPEEESISKIITKADEVPEDKISEEGVGTDRNRTPVKRKKIKMPSVHEANAAVLKEEPEFLEYQTIKPTLIFVKSDWDVIYKMIKLRRETIRDYMITAIVAYTKQQLLFNRITNESIVEHAREDVRRQIEDEIEKKLIVKKSLWEPKYGKSPETKTRELVNEKIKKELKLNDNLDAEEKEDKDKLLERLKKNRLWKPRYGKKPPAITSKVDKSEDESLEEDVDRMNNPQSIDDNFMETITTVGVMPEEKGIEPAPADPDAPTQEEMMN